MPTCPTCGQETDLEFMIPENMRVTDLQLRGMLAKNEVVDFSSPPEEAKAETSDKQV